MKLTIEQKNEYTIYNIFFNDLADMEQEEIVSGFIKQYYIDKKDFPNKIMLRYDLEDKASLESWLEQMAGRKVALKSPQKGEKLRFVEMAEANRHFSFFMSLCSGIMKMHPVIER